jgi:small subunit ribosomal protein S19
MLNENFTKLNIKFLDLKLYSEIKTQLISGDKNYILKTQVRNSMIYPCFINLTISVYNGKKYIPLKIHKNFVGHKFGEFIPTRKCGHTKQNVASKVKKKISSTLYRQYFDNCRYKVNILEQKDE